MALLEARNVSKSFGAIQALEEVSFSIEPGEALGLMGDNGAGKSTHGEDHGRQLPAHQW